VRILIVFYLLFIGILALLAQMILPAHFRILSLIGFGSALIPLLVIYASLELGDERAPVLAGLLGLMIDLLSSHHRLGVTVLMLSSLSALVVTQAAKAESHQWVFRFAYVLIGTFTYELMDYLFTLTETLSWHWPLEVWSKIAFSSLLNVLLCPLVFLTIGFLPRRFGWRPDHEIPERSYAR